VPFDKLTIKFEIFDLMEEMINREYFSNNKSIMCKCKTTLLFENQL